jgi:uncharacterized damage-inducible protein DinB
MNKIFPQNFLRSVALVAVCFGTILFSCGNADAFPGGKDAILARWVRARAYTKEYLEAATQEVYDFKPTSEMRTFGQQMLHLANGSYGLVNAATGVGSPYKFQDLEKQPLKTKAEITNAVLASYDFVIEVIKNLNETQLTSAVKIFDYKMTVEEGIEKAFEHQTHHRGQSTVYLRLKGITPPHEKLF